ncbi:MAG: NAD+ synthase, partial [Microcystaceae cyanobacterium]
KQQLREDLVRHTVKTYQIPIIYINQVGGNDDLIFDGYSFACNHQGELVSRSPGFQESLSYLDWSDSQQDLLPTVQHNLATSAEEELFQALVLGVRDYAHKCSFSQAILGLSGGIDSSLVAAIAVEALGSDKVLGVL